MANLEEFRRLLRTMCHAILVRANDQEAHERLFTYFVQFESVQWLRPAAARAAGFTPNPAVLEDVEHAFGLIRDALRVAFERAAPDDPEGVPGAPGAPDAPRNLRIEARALIDTFFAATDPVSGARSHRSAAQAYEHIQTGIPNFLDMIVWWCDPARADGPPAALREFGLDLVAAAEYLYFCPMLFGQVQGAVVRAARAAEQNVRGS